MSGAVLCSVQGTVPVTAFTIDSGVIAVSTAIGIVAKEAVEHQSSGYVLYVFIVFCVAWTTKSLLYWALGFGGGSLAPPGRVDSVSCANFLGRGNAYSVPSVNPTILCICGGIGGRNGGHDFALDCSSRGRTRR